MIYLERTPAAPLNAFVRNLWYARAPEVLHGRERVLPGGAVQIIINLARDYIWDCPDGAPQRQLPPALVVGVRSTYEIVDRSDMTHLIGAIFHPGGFAPFSRGPVDEFSKRSVSLEDAWGPGARSLRDRLVEATTAQMKLGLLERFLLDTFAARLSGNGLVEFAVSRFGQGPAKVSIQDVADETGWSLRRFSQVFREQVGLSPKAWCRVQRFQHAVQQLHAGVEVRWSELALDCGYYDQSHFANEFRAFSGIDATSYSARRGQWANHIAVN